MLHYLYTVALLCITSTSYVVCSLQDKITQSADKIIILKQDIISGKDVQNITNMTPTCQGTGCGGTRCCGNKCNGSK